MKILLVYLALLPLSSSANFNNSYPTLAIVEYTSNCIATNYGVVSALQSCSCSIDVIAKELSYDKYVELETISRMQQIQGEKTLIYKNSHYRKKQDSLYKAQIKANKLCFSNAFSKPQRKFPH